MAFAIRLLPERVPGVKAGAEARYGEIRIGEYQETFVALIGLWTPEDYEAHWRQATSRLVRSGQPSCLITSVYHPTESDLVRWWLLYPEGERVFMREALLIQPQIPRRFNPSDPYSFIPPRHEAGEDGQEVSEWELPLQDFEDFSNSRRGR